MNKNNVFNLDKLLYICCARPNGRTVRHIVYNLLTNYPRYVCINLLRCMVVES